MNDPSDVAEVMDRAARRVAEMLRMPEQLDRVEQLRLRTSKKKAAVDARLKTTVSNQLDDVQEGITLINKALADIKGIQENLKTVDVSYDSCRELQKHIVNVRALCDARNQLKATMDQIDRIFTVPEIVDELDEMFNEQPPNYLKLHHEISKLEKCRVHLMEHMEKSGSGRRSAEIGKASVETYFSAVSVLERKLEQALLYEAQDPITIVKTDPTRLVSVLRIIEREEKLDKVLPPSDVRPKGLKKKMYQKLEMAIENRFDTQLFKNSVARFLRAFEQFYFQDLLIAKDELPPRFPPDEDIFLFFLHQYHNRLCIMVENFQTSNEIDPAEIMMLLNWVPVYTKDMLEKLGVDVNELGQKLLGAGEEDLRDYYLKMMETKLIDWVKNLVTQDADKWLTDMDDLTEPDINGDGLFFSDTPVILFQMINQQVDVAFQPGGGESFALELVKLCFGSLKKFQTEYITNLLEIAKTYFTETPKETPQYLTENIMVAVNINQRARQYVTDLQTSLQEHYPPEAPENLYIQTECKAAVAGFHKVALLGSELLVDQVTHDTRKVMEGLFNLKWMRSKTTMKTICATVHDYARDFREHLHEFYTLLTLQRLEQVLLIEYVKAMFEKRHVLKAKEDRDVYIERLEEETQMWRYLFEEYDIVEDDTGRDPTVVLVYIRQLLMASGGMIVVAWKKLRAEYPDVSLHHLEAFLTLRDDFSQKEARKFIRDQIAAKEDESSLEPEKVSRERAFFETIDNINTSATYKPGEKD